MEASDAEAFHSYRSDPEVSRYHRCPLPALESVRTFFGTQRGAKPFTAVAKRAAAEPKGPRHDGLCAVQTKDWCLSGHCYCLCRHCWIQKGIGGSCICSECPCGGWRKAASLGMFQLVPANEDRIRDKATT